MLGIAHSLMKIDPSQAPPEPSPNARAHLPPTPPPAPAEQSIPLLLFTAQVCRAPAHMCEPNRGHIKIHSKTSTPQTPTLNLRHRVSWGYLAIPTPGCSRARVDSTLPGISGSPRLCCEPSLPLSCPFGFMLAIPAPCPAPYLGSGTRVEGGMLLQLPCF